MDQHLQEIAENIRSGQVIPSTTPSTNVENTTLSLRQQSRLLNSSIAQIVSATHGLDQKQIGIAALEVVQALGDFTDSVEDLAIALQNAKDRASVQMIERHVLRLHLN